MHPAEKSETVKTVLWLCLQMTAADAVAAKRVAAENFILIDFECLRDGLRWSDINVRLSEMSECE